MRNNAKKIGIWLAFIIFGIISGTRVDAYIPVTYVCCQNYSFSNGTFLNGFEDTLSSGVQLDDFGNINNWIVGGTGAIQQVDTVNFIYGSQGLKLITSNGNRAYTDKVINNNFSTTNNFVVWLYVYNISTFDYVTMYLTSNGTSWKTYFSNNYYSLQQGWNKVIFNKKDFITNSSNPESWSNVMNRIRLSIWPLPNVNTTATFDNLRYNMTNDWTVGGSGASLQPDTTNFVEGQQGLKLIATNGTAYSDLVINNSFSTTNNFDIWAYIENASSQSGITMYITSNGSKWNKFFYDPEWDGVKSGWNHLVFNKHNFKNVGGEDWNNMMNRVRLRIYPRYTNLNVTFDSLTYNMSGQKAKLMFQFDDGDISIYQKAFPILNSNNQSGISTIVTAWVGGNRIMNFSNLKTLQAAGWDISSHTVDHPSLTTLDDISLTNELNNSYRWLVINGFQKSAGFIAYPYGSFNDNVISKTRQRYVFGRATYVESSQQYSSSSDNTIKYIQRLIDTSDVQNVTDQINDTINSKLLTILLFHVVNDTNPSNDPYTILTSDFQNISNYVKSRNDIDVITYSDNYVIPQINNFTPVINKTTRIYSNGTSIIMVNNKYDEYMPNMTVSPSSDFEDIYITTYDETGGTVIFNESGINSNSQVSYSIGDRKPNWLYTVNLHWANGSNQSFNLISNDTGYINYHLNGPQNSGYQDIEPQAVDTSFTITLPVGYTSLRFNASNSNVNNLSPDGQTDSQSFFNIMNNGNINQSFTLYLDGIPVNITTYADLSNNFSSGKIQINTSNSTSLVNLGPGNNQNIWMLIDANNAPPTNVIKNLGIGISKIIPGFVSSDCDPSLWNHVWGENQNLTYRLLSNVTYSCIRVSGTIDSMDMEDDGDYHIDLHLDSQYASLLNQLNNINSGGDLVTEIVCANPNSVNEAVCNNFNQSYLLNNLSKGAYIYMTGAYVTDLGEGGWNEIHPITAIGPAFLNSAANRSNYNNIGDTIQYTYNVKNIGNVDLSGITITDNKTGTVPCSGILSAGQSIQCQSNYTIVQKDIDNGAVTDSAFISIVSNNIILNSNIASTTVFKK